MCSISIKRNESQQFDYGQNLPTCEFFLAHYMVRTGSGKLWKVMEIDNAIFQDLETFGKRDVFQSGYEKFWKFVWENSKNMLKWI